ncbi:MAG: hypothetical protein JWL77_3372 [Chthonomonadaceae bacterium]|nr:hypothetical protein [Chthonomonadaceae bacterium]
MLTRNMFVQNFLQKKEYSLQNASGTLPAEQSF